MKNLKNKAIIESVYSHKYQNIFYLTEKESVKCNELADYLLDRYGILGCNEFVYYAHLYAHHLPKRLFGYLNEFKYREDNFGACIVRGYYIDDSGIGPTPNVEGYVKKTASTIKEEYLFMLLGTVLGDLMSWNVYENGAIINDLVPLRGNEREQLGTSSHSLLDWHVEEAFHPLRSDYLGLLCLRNFDGVATTISNIGNTPVPSEIKQVLFESRFLIETDDNWSKSNLSTEPVSILFGDYNNPYIRIDLPFTSAIPHDNEAENALRFICNLLSDNLEDIVLSPGDFCFIDNYRAVHGRRPFVPKYNGKDRWVKRTLITRDLRKSRTVRKHASSRILTVD